MLLNNSYVSNNWCSLEFAAAHKRVLKDKTNFLIIILHEEVDRTNLDEDLKAYLNTNNYIERTSQWFWQRLLYSLPQVPLATLRGQAMPPGGWAEAVLPCEESLRKVRRAMAEQDDNDQDIEQNAQQVDEEEKQLEIEQMDHAAQGENTKQELEQMVQAAQGGNNPLDLEQNAQVDQGDNIGPEIEQMEVDDRLPLIE